MTAVLHVACAAPRATAPDAVALDASTDAAPAQPVDWRERSIYFVVTDRFANGDPSNDGANGYASDRSDPRKWHGGDFRGLIDRLDYIAGMGFTGLWITPIVEQHDVRGYHGYWGWDWSKVDAHLGDLATLHELVDAAHTRGIAVMIDTVANHTGRYNYTSPTFPDAAMYHHNGNIVDYGNREEVETHDLSGLNDLDQSVPEVRAKLLDHVRWLVGTARADGLRVDTVKHVPEDFWRDYQAAAGVYTIGEVLDGSVDNVARYSHVLSATLDYPLYFAMREVFGKGGSARKLGDVFAKDAAYADAGLGGLFLDNHDQPRFLCDATGDKLARLRLALAFIFTARGVPVVYSGTEQAFASCTDNREDMFDRADANHPLYALIRRLHDIRSGSAAIRGGVQRERWQDDTAYAFERESGASAVVVAVNISGNQRTLPLVHLHVPAGTKLTDALGSGASFVVGADQAMAVTVPANSIVILTNE
jgi:glycosidase